MNALQNYNKNTYRHPDGIKKIFITPKSVAFVREVKRNALTACRGQISEPYINKTCKTFTNGYIYVKGNHIAGFVLWKIDIPDPADYINMDLLPSKRLFIQLICAEKTGADFGYTILSDVEAYCTMNTIPLMSLEAGNEQLEAYYRKFEFITVGFVPMTRGRTMYKPVLELLQVSREDRGKTRKRGRGKLSAQDASIITFLHTNGSRIEKELQTTIESNEYFNRIFNSHSSR